MLKAQVSGAILRKDAANKPWFFSCTVDGGTVSGDISIGGGVQLGQNLRNALSTMQEQSHTYPYPWPFGNASVANGSNEWDFDVQYTGIGKGTITYLEMTYWAYKQFLSKVGTSTKSKSSSKSNVGSYAITEEIPLVNTHLLIGTLSKVKDGDTLDMMVEATSVSMAQYAPVGSVQTIRLAAIQTPETRAHNNVGNGDQYGNAKNSDYASLFHITQDAAYDVADESTNNVTNIFHSYSHMIVVVDNDPSGGGMPYKESHGRWIGMVYAVKSNTDTTGLNVNKTQIATPSQYIKGVVNGQPDYVPLAIVQTQYYYGGEGNSVFDIPLWDTTYSYGHQQKIDDITKYKADQEEQARQQVIQDIEDMTTLNDRTVTTIKGVDNPNHLTIAQLAEQYNTIPVILIQLNQTTGESDQDTINKIQNPPSGVKIKVPVTTTVGINFNDGTATFAEPDFIDNRNQIPALDDRPAATSPFHLRIADVELMVPPLSIQVNRTSNLVKAKALRTKSSIITRSGSSNVVITLQLYFHDLDSMNGTEVDAPHGGKYYMNGLRSLIAQFKKAPFLPVENEHLNLVHDIQQVALVDMTISTVPGFPHSLSATLTLAKFEHEAYMPQVSFMDQVMNYPLFRWYYQQAMQDRGPYNTYLAPITGDLTNDFTFQLINEDILKQKLQAQQDLQQYDDPARFQQKVENGDNLIGQLKKDSDMIAKIRAQKAVHDKLIAQGAITGRADDQIMPSGEIFQKIWGDKIDFGGGWYLPVDYRTAETNGKRNNNIEYAVMSFTALINENGLPKSAIKLYEPSSWLPSFAQTANVTVYMIPINDPYIDTIANRGQQAQTAIDAFTYDYNKVKGLADLTEGTLSQYLQDYTIQDLYVTGMSVMYENSFATVNPEMLADPAMQFLGAQDPYLQVTMEIMSKDGVTQLQNLLSEVDRYQREYRFGITAGFFGLKNQLTALFGVTTVIPEAVKINTVPGFVDRFQVEMTLCGFDKTQKRSESLQGLNAVDVNTKLEDRDVSKDPVGHDSFVLDLRFKQLEVYPDLELPTYQELNNTLPNLKAGFSVMQNPSGAKFLDPDFYISTDWSMRQWINQERVKQHSATIQDLAGYTVISGPYKTDSKGNTVQTTGPYYDGDVDALLQMMQTIDDKGKMMQVNLPSQADNGGNIASGGMNGLTPTPSGIMNVGDPTAYMTNEQHIDTPPSYDVWASWQSASANANTPDNVAMRNTGSLQGQYQQWISGLRNPSPAEVYAEMYRLIQAIWGGSSDLLCTAADNIKTGALWFTDDMQALIYARIGDFSDASAYLLANNNPSFSTYKGSMTKPSGVVLNTFEKYCWSPKNNRPRIPLERLANYIKSTFHDESGWNQFVNKNGQLVPNLSDDGGWSVGITQPRLDFHGKTVEEKIRLCWDWKYNLEYGIRYWYGMYMTAYNSSNYDLAQRPWDWAVRGFNQGNVNGQLAIPYYTKVMSYFDGTVDNVDSTKRNGIYNSPNGKYNSPVAQPDLGIMSLVTGTPINKLTQKPDSYDQIMAAHGGYGSRSSSAGVNAGAYVAMNQTLNAQQYQNLQISEKARLTGQDTPAQIWKDMYTDMCQYDQRGRFLRAFPTYQMFIIDEGRWMNTYKLWDNLYGFNSILSIDVHKNRKIAADTVVIQMSNVYSNLNQRNMALDYGDWDYDFWENIFWKNPSQSILDARKELQDTMILKTGARIHLRMGYGSDATQLPVMFNGTITELDIQDVAQIVAQGDGLELTNPISADPSDSNTKFGMIIEPRDFLCQLMCSKGNWFKDVLNDVSNGLLFQDNPLGIQHFGSPLKVPAATFKWLDEDFGEAAQNIYSQNGCNTFSQWVYKDGSSIGVDLWGGFVPVLKGDEDNIQLKIYTMTPWDVAQTFAKISADYITAVHPFELRSTLFFGKPYWALAYKYENSWSYNTTDKQWERTLTAESRKPFMQAHIFDSNTDIVSNQIKVSDQDIYTNVIATYDGQQTPVYYADWDIRFDKQKTRIVEAPIVKQFWDYATSQKQAGTFAASNVRDYLKDMYKGSLLIFGDPTVKPFDLCYLNDQIHMMNGTFLVKDVTHHFSYETGFVTSVTPDAYVVNDDLAMMKFSTWGSSFGMSAVAGIMGRKLMATAIRKTVGSAAVGRVATAGNWVVRNAMKLSAKLPGGTPEVKEFKSAMQLYLNANTDDERMQAAKWMLEAQQKVGAKVDEWVAKGILEKSGRTSVKGLLYVTKGLLQNLSEGKKIFDFARKGGLALLKPTPLGIISTLAMTVIADTIGEWYKRKKREFQCVILQPLQYQGREFTAGINGHRGMVVGDNPGKWDQFFMGMGYGGKDDWTKTAGEVMNFFLDDSDQEIYNNVMNNGSTNGPSWGSGSRQFSFTQQQIDDQQNQQG